MPDSEVGAGTPEGIVQAAMTEDVSEGQTPEGAEGSSTPSLGEEFKPYSQFPWEKIPDEVRGEVLEKVKKFHGDMTRSHEDLRKQRDDARQKAQWFDELTGQQWFMDAYMKRQNGGTTPAPAPERPSLDKLTEFGIDKSATEVLGRVMREEIQAALRPVTENVDFLRRMAYDREANDELGRVREYSKARGLPSPDAPEISEQMTALIRSGQARSIEGAYRLAIFEQALGAAETRGRKTLEQELESKAGATVAPYRGPASAPGEEQFTGREGVVNALRAAQAEFAARKGRSL